jgi:membrane-associated PAP2 superfamily phosphatase
MNRTGLLIALAVAVVVGVVFGFYPSLDLRIAAPFHDIAIGNNKFGMRIYPPVMAARDIGLWIVTVFVALPLAAFVLKLVLPRRRLIIPARAIIFLVVTMALGPGVLVNGVLKDYWGRPRPIDVQQFGGDQHFVAWWDRRGDCPANCSFVSGDVSGAFWTLAPAALAPPQVRVIAYGAALTFGAGMAALRIVSGGHFFSDTAFAGVFTFLIIWLAYALIYRWPRTRLNEEKIESAIERIATPGYDFVAKLLGRKSRP